MTGLDRLITGKVWSKVKGMSTKGRLLSIIMIISILLSCSAFSVSASSEYTLKVSATQNYAEAQQVLKLINKKRAKRGLSKLKLDKSLCRSAARRAAELTVYIPDSSPHKRPNGKLATTVNSRIIYECCAEGQETPKEVVREWMNSPPHRKGILLSNARSVGIGCIMTKNSVRFWTLEFSSDRAEKTVKSRKKVTTTYTINTLSKNLKKNHFYIDLRSTPVEWSDNVVEAGDTVSVIPFFRNNLDFTTQLRPSDYKWKSSKKSVATIDSKGRVKAKKAGTAVIYATMKSSPKYKLKKKIKVIPKSGNSDYYD